ncbi:MAG: hypothetical protein V1708_01380 [Candidatus Micrarchaeota archaeon]
MPLIETFKLFSFTEVPVPGSLHSWLERELHLSGVSCGAAEFFSAAFCIACISSASAFLIAVALLAGLQVALLAAVASFAAVLSALLFIPSYCKARRAGDAEAGLGACLRVLALELEQMPFERALADACRGDGVLDAELRRALREADSGVCTMPDALSRLAGRFDSVAVARAVSQLNFVYWNGRGASALRRQADELLSVSKSQLRRFSSQMSLLGIVFITASAIVPALFAAYAAIGSSFLEFSFTPEQLLLAYAVAFPAADAVILLYVREKTPRIA